MSKPECKSVNVDDLKQENQKELYDLNWKIELVNGGQIVKYAGMHKIID